MAVLHGKCKIEVSLEEMALMLTRLKPYCVRVYFNWCDVRTSEKLHEQFSWSESLTILNLFKCWLMQMVQMHRNKSDVRRLGWNMETQIHLRLAVVLILILTIRLTVGRIAQHSCFSTNGPWFDTWHSWIFSTKNLKLPRFIECALLRESGQCKA